ncbi:unnamed protein product [Phytophthora fragariaefolia]|uniref:Unnamed protein product n=1 Tax=Phytophthora fragariaefolia TaxID=1490495 RepID=A0A9W7D1E8_9STRA|nr:unnamed protein product [Phytophthora fragariaefolia]
MHMSKEKDYGLLRNDKAGVGGTNTASTPPTTAADQHHDQNWHIPRDFQRRWSPEQVDALQAWAREEDRIEREQQNRERVYMGFEDAIAYIVNERPRNLLAEPDFDADDLVDDGEDEDEAITGDVDVSNATSPWGVVPPPRIEIAPNSVYKPEIPHGEIVHADMASYFRIVEQLYSSGDEDIEATTNPAPFLWQAIYPQDSTRYPIYNAGGKYSVKLFVFGRWRRVDVDDKLPLDSDGNVVYLASSMKNEIWPSLLVKALYKVIYWLHPNLNQNQEPGQTSLALVDNMCQTVVEVVLALTSWKISRWEPEISHSFSENIYHQLQLQVDEPISEVSLDGDPVADGTVDVPAADEEIAASTVTKSPPKASNHSPLQYCVLPITLMLLQPRAIICSAGYDRVADMIFGEAALVSDIVGDTGSTTFKVIRHGGTPTAISEEATGVHELVFLLIHPLLPYSDTLSRAWLPNPEPLLEGNANGRAPFIPFETPRVQFVTVSMQDAVTKQPAGDSSIDIVHIAPATVNLVATLTPVQVIQQPDQNVDNLGKPSILMATHLGVDPNGSVILIEEKESKSSRSSLPATVTVNSIFSGYITFPAVNTGSIVYRMYPQKSLRYGYSMQVESDYKVVFQDAPTYWRSLSSLHVMECDGIYPVMLPKSWNIIFKQTFELSPLTEENGRSSVSPSELRIDLHLAEDLLVGFTHISIVNDITGEIKTATTLCTKILLPAALNDGLFAPTAYTLIVDCAPGNFHVREGKWKLTLASDWDITKSTTQQTKLTRFEGVYEPNKPQLLFRDVITAPNNSIWTSFQLQLLQDGDIVNGLSAKLEVFDFGTDQHPRIGEVSAKGEVRLLQLPCIPAGEVSQPSADDKRGYILQGSIDRSTCIVPDELQSLRPFRSDAGRIPPKRTTTTPVDEKEPSEAASSGESNLPTTARSSRGPSDIKWRVNCWSTEEVKLLEDNTKELQYEAIRASWAEKAVDRNTNGAVSRLLYLGKLDEAEARMRQDNMADEQIAKVKSRFEWVQAVKAKAAAKLNTAEGVGESYLEEVVTGDERLLSEDELADSSRLLLERIGIVEADREQRRVACALAKEERAQELKNTIRAVIEKRAASVKRQHELKRELAAVQTQSV